MRAIASTPLANNTMHRNDQPRTNMAPLTFGRLMVRFGTALLLVLLVLCAPHRAAAHRVNVFAWAEAGHIRAESTFSNGNPAQSSRMVLRDKTTGKVLAEATTDTKGTCFFPITDALRASRPLLELELLAGEGHRNTWDMAPEEYLAAATTPVQAAVTTPVVPSPSQAATPPLPATAVSTTARATATPSAGNSQQDNAQAGNLPVDEATLRRIVDEALEAKLAPLRRSLAGNETGPRMTDIIGGIGYLVGLAGLAAWARSRRR